MQALISGFVKEGKRSLQDGDYKTLGKLILESHKLKKNLNTFVQQISNLYNFHSLLCREYL